MLTQLFIEVARELKSGRNLVCFQMHTSAEVFYHLRNYLFLKNDITLEGAVPHNALYYQQLFIVRYKVDFYANDYFA